MTRRRLPSYDDVERIARDQARRAVEESRGHILPIETSTPPAMRFVQKAWWRFSVKVFWLLMTGALGAGGGWIARDCRAAVENHVAR